LNESFQQITNDLGVIEERYSLDNLKKLKDNKDVRLNEKWSIGTVVKIMDKYAKWASEITEPFRNLYEKHSINIDKENLTLAMTFYKQPSIRNLIKKNKNLNEIIKLVKNGEEIAAKEVPTAKNILEKIQAALKPETRTQIFESRIPKFFEYFIEFQQILIKASNLSEANKLVKDIHKGMSLEANKLVKDIHESMNLLVKDIHSALSLLVTDKLVKDIKAVEAIHEGMSLPEIKDLVKAIHNAPNLSDAEKLLQPKAQTKKEVQQDSSEVKKTETKSELPRIKGQDIRPLKTETKERETREKKLRNHVTQEMKYLQWPYSNQKDI
jgi:hypothetical protein